MFLTIHGATGIIIGQRLSNPILVFIVAFIFHYIFDIIPHGDSNAPKKYKNPIHIGLAAIIDFIILVIYLIFLSFRINILKSTYLIAIFAALLPDFLQAIYFMSNKKILTNWQKAHDFFHDIIAKKFEWNFYFGIVFQFIILIILTSIII